MIFWFTVIYVSVALASRFAWLWFCDRIAKEDPQRAAAIISASGRHFPFGRTPWRWPWGRND